MVKKSSGIPHTLEEDVEGVRESRLQGPKKSHSFSHFATCYVLDHDPEVMIKRLRWYALNNETYTRNERR